MANIFQSFGNALQGGSAPAPNQRAWNPDVLTAIGLGLMSGSSPSASLAGVGNYLPQAIQLGRQRKSINEYLAAQGDAVSPATRAFLSKNPDIASTYIGQTLVPPTSDDIKEYTYAKRPEGGGFKGTLQDWMKVKSAAAKGGTNYGLAPVWGTDATGNTTMFQLNDAGTDPRQVKFPPGVTPSKTSKIDLGTEWGITDQAGNVIQRIPKNLEGAAAATARGTALGGLQTALPVVEHASNLLASHIDEVLNDPALASITGPVQGRLPRLSGDAQRAQSRVDQLLGETFLVAYNELRGAQAITDIEGQKATAAKNRLMSMSMDDKDYRGALLDFRKEVFNLLAIARQRAGASGAPLAQTSTQVPPQTPPNAGSGIVDYTDYFK
jgi:hypothetical protein